MLRKPAGASVSDSAGAPESAEAEISRFGLSLATIPHMEAMAIPSHMRYGSMICSKRLQSDRPHKRLSLLALVLELGNQSRVAYLK